MWRLSNTSILNSLRPIDAFRRQTIIWTNDGILLIGPLGTNFSEILTGIQAFSFKKMHMKMSSAKWRPFCLGLNVLNMHTYSDLALSHAFHPAFSRRSCAPFLIQLQPIMCIIQYTTNYGKTLSVNHQHSEDICRRWEEMFARVQCALDKGLLLTLYWFAVQRNWCEELWMQEHSRIGNFQTQHGRFLWLWYQLYTQWYLLQLNFCGCKQVLYDKIWHISSTVINDGTSSSWAEN